MHLAGSADFSNVLIINHQSISNFHPKCATRTLAANFLLFLKNDRVTDSLSLRGCDDGCKSNETLVSGHGYGDRDIYRCRLATSAFSGKN